MDPKDYELAYLIVEEETMGRVEAILLNCGAEILNHSPLKNINLAYSIREREQAFFGCLTFRILPEKMVEARRTLSLDKGILRFLIIAPPIAKPESRRWPAPTPGTEPPKVGGPPSLSNEALEKQIEEILS